MKNFTLIILFINMLVLALLSSKSIAQPVDDKLLANLKTFSGETIVVDKTKITHLVFIDLWRSYEGKGDEKIIASLPMTFLQQSQQLWLQPEVNVTKAQLAEFQQYFPKVTPLIFDQQFSLMRALQVWQSPFHVLVKDNKKVFSGDSKALLNFISNKYSTSINSNIISNTTSSDSVNTEKMGADIIAKEQVIPEVLLKEGNKSIKPKKPNKPIVGDKAPQFSARTLAGKKVTLAGALVKLNNRKPLNLVFIDALCPMPHFPDCEAKLTHVNTLMKADNTRQWLGVVNSYYVNEEFAQQFADKFSLELPLIFDQDNTIYRAYDVYASPYQIKVNQQGVIESRSEILN